MNLMVKSITMKVKKLLLHVCCAPCSIGCVESLRAEGIEPALYWYNPNIHPRTEYISRRDCLADYAKKSGLELVIEDQYGLRDFILGLCGGVPNTEAFTFRKRCVCCYRLRLEKTARTAKENGFDAFSTSLLISPYQDHALLQTTAEQAARQNGSFFLYRDFRPVFRESRQKAREAACYMQKYCGCIFSEEERYSPKNNSGKLV